MASFREGWALGRRVTEAAHHLIEDSATHQKAISNQQAAASPALKPPNHLAKGGREKKYFSLMGTES